MPPAVLVAFLSLFVLDPRDPGNYHTVGQLTRLHRNFTSPPSLWPGRELRKYHCLCDRIVAGRPCQWSAEQTVDRSSFSESRRQSDPCSPVRECNRNADMKLSRFKNPSTSFMGTENLFLQKEIKNI